MLRDYSEKDQMQGSASSLRQYIMDIIGYGQESEASLLEMHLKFGEEDKEWIMLLVKRVGSLYWCDEAQADVEEKVVVHGDRSIDMLGLQDIEVAEKMDEVWKPISRLRVICLNAIRLDVHTYLFRDLQEYVSRK